MLNGLEMVPRFTPKLDVNMFYFPDGIFRQTIRMKKKYFESFPELTQTLLDYPKKVTHKKKINK